MVYPLIRDIHEPELIKFILQKSLHVITENNEPDGFADYYWNYGNLTMWERKKGLEFLAEIGGKIDTQLVKYVTAHPDAEIGIIQEGLITPDKDGNCIVWKVSYTRNDNPRLVPQKWPSKMQPRDYAGYRAWVYRRSVEGIPTIITLDEYDTALTLAAMVDNSMKTTHEGLRRSVVIKATKEDPYVPILAALPGIGRKTATDLINRYKVPWALYSIPFDLLCNLEGKRIATLIHQGIGR